MKNVKKASKKVAAFVLSTTMVAGMGVTAFAEEAQVTYDNPTQAVKITRNADHSASWGTDGKKYITATAHRAASPTLGMMGLTATSGFGMVGGSAPADLAAAKSAAALGIWGTTLNQSYDPYYYNYFYNYYAAANGKETTTDALLNPAVSASPMMADMTVKDEWGGVSVSLYTRPQILIGVQAGGASADDQTGYDSQLATINSLAKDSDYYQEGDENYNPYKVSYCVTSIADHINTVYNVAAAMDKITKDTGAVGRYGSGEDIAETYENYAYGIPAYVLSKIADKTVARKTVANVTKYDEASKTYTIEGSASTMVSTTSLARIYQYTSAVTNNLADKLNKTTVTAEELAQADVIIDTKSAVTDDALTKKVINPDAVSSLYGITMNSTENIFGEALTISMIYPEVLDAVKVGAYFYKNLYHLTETGVQKAITVNYAKLSVADSIKAEVNKVPSSYNSDVQSQIDAGVAYYMANKASLSKVTLYENGWKAVENMTDISNAKITLSKTSVAYTGKQIKPSVTVSVPTKLGSTIVNPSEYKVTYSNNTKVGTATVTISANGKQVYGSAKATFKIKKASQKLTVKATTKTVKYSKLKKAKQTVKAIKVSSNKGKLSYAKKSGSSKLSVSKSTGKITVKKGTKKGTYKVNVTVKAASTSTLNAVAKTVKVTVKVK